MKKIFPILAILFLSLSASAQDTDAIDRFFTQYQDDEDFTMVYVSPKMFKMVAKVAEGEMDAELESLVNDLKGLKILQTEVNAAARYKEAIKKIPTSEYEILMTARDDGQDIKILTKTQGEDIIQELLLLVGGSDEFILVSFVGNINLNDLAKVASSLDIEGVKHLEKLGQ